MSGGEEELNSTEKTAMLIKAMVETTHSYNGILTDIRKKMRGASALLEDISNKEIAQLVLYESIINDLLSALVPTNIIISNLLSGKIFALSENEHELIEDIFLGIGQLIELSQSTLKNTVNIREAYSTIMTNNLNRVIKLLTILTIVLTIPMIISGFLGMNIPVPLADSPYGFILTVGISIAISIGLFYILKKKKWL
jgi:magnesium transporter